MAIWLVIFAESGILIGLFFPGDTLLVTAGLFAGHHKLSLAWLLLVVITASIAGYQVGYIFGERVGPKLFKRKDGILLKKEYVERTAGFFDKYGPITLVVARFIAHVRTIVSIVAGTAKMNKKTFFTYNVIGAVLWCGSMVMLGYWLGTNIDNVDKYFFPVVFGGLIVIYLVTMWGILKSPDRRKAVAKGLKEDWQYYFREKK